MEVNPNENLIYRQAQFETDDINIEERTVLLKFSSEYPVNRGNSFEVLSHKAGDYDLSYLNDNGPVLVQHNNQRQVGSVVSAWVDNGFGYAKVKFSSKGEGDVIFTDIVDKIRNKISCGYSASEPKLLERRDGAPVYSYKWVAREISVVGVGADPTAKIGRSEEIIDTLIRQSFPVETNITQNEPQEVVETIINERNIQMELENSKIEDVISSIETETRSAEVEHITRGASIADVEAICKHFRMEDEVEALVARSATLDEVKAHVQAKWKETSRATRSIAAPAVHTRTQEAFNVAKALRAATTEDWSDAGFEREMSQEGVRGTGQSWNKRTFTVDMGTRADSISTVGTAGSVGNLVQVNQRPQDLIDILWAKTALGQLPVHRETGIKDNQQFPVVTSKATAWMVGETGAIGDAESVTTAVKNASPHQMVTKSALSLTAQFQTTPSTEAIIYNQIFNAIALKLDQMLLAPTQVVGELTSLLAAITGGQVIAGGTNGAAPSRTNLLKLVSLLSDANINDASTSFLTNRRTVSTLNNTLNDSANTASQYIIPVGASTDSLLGKPLIVSNNVPGTLTKGSGTALSPIIAGDFSELFVGQWNNLVVKVDDVTGADNSLVFVRSYSWWDFLIKRLEAFAAIKDVITI